MNILYLAAYFSPEKFSSNIIYSTILEELANKHNVYVIAPQPTRGVQEDEYLNYKSYEEHNGIKIYRFPMVREEKGTVKRFIRYFKCHRFYKKISKQIPHIDCVFAASTPPTLGLVAGAIARKKKSRFVYSLQDVFPDSLITTGILKKRSGIIWRIGQWVEKKIYSISDKIVVVSRDMRDNLLAKGVDNEKIELVYNFVDISKCVPIKREANTMFDEYDLDRDLFYVVYAGNFGKAQNLDLLINVANLMKNETTVRFLLIGEGVEEAGLRRKAEELQLTNLRFIPMQSPERISEVYSLGDVSVVMCQKGAGSSAMPSKTWSIMACNTPLVAAFDEATEMEKIILESLGGEFVPAGNDLMMVDAIKKVKMNRDLQKDIYSNGRSYIEKNMSKELCVRKYVEIVGEAK